MRDEREWEKQVFFFGALFLTTDGRISIVNNHCSANQRDDVYVKNFDLFERERVNINLATTCFTVNAWFDFEKTKQQHRRDNYSVLLFFFVDHCINFLLMKNSSVLDRSKKSNRLVDQSYERIILFIYAWFLWIDTRAKISILWLRVLFYLTNDYCLKKDSRTNRIERI